MTDFLLSLLYYTVVLPLSLMAATPFVLVFAVFPQGGYWHTVRRFYRRVMDFWSFMTS